MARRARVWHANLFSLSLGQRCAYLRATQLHITCTHLLHERSLCGTLVPLSDTTVIRAIRWNELSSLLFSPPNPFTTTKTMKTKTTMVWFAWFWSQCKPVLSVVRDLELSDPRGRVKYRSRFLLEKIDRQTKWHVLFECSRAANATSSELVA